MKIGITSVVATLGLVGLLASCTSPNLGLTPKISGSVGGYSGGEKTIKVRAFGGSGDIIATGILKADGSFGVDLPALAAASLSTIGTPPCSSGTASATPATAKTSFALAGVFDTPSSLTPSGYLTQTELATGPAMVGAKETLVGRLYADVDVVLTASNCVTGSDTASGTWTLKAGWNEISYTREVTAISPTKTRTTFSMGTAGKPWRIESSSLGFFKFPLIRQ